MDILGSATPTAMRAKKKMDPVTQAKALDFARAMELSIQRKFKGIQTVNVSTESKEENQLGSAFDSLTISRDNSSGSTCSKGEDSMEPFQRLRTISRLEQDIFTVIHKNGDYDEIKDEKSTPDDESTSKSITLAFNLPVNMGNRSSSPKTPLTVTTTSSGELAIADEKPSSSSTHTIHSSTVNTKDLKEIADAKISDGSEMTGLELSSPTLSSASSVRKLSMAGSGRLRRRNSTGTLYIDHTMRMQDDKATVRCLCSVIRAHMLEVVEKRAPYPREYSTFLDREYKHLSTRDGTRFNSNGTTGVSLEADEKSPDIENYSKVPSLEDVMDTFSYIFERSQMESECIIITLIYLERIKLATNGKLSIRYENWKSVLLSCIMMASKVWDDLSMLNVDFSKICPSFGLKTVNKLETTLLEILMYEVRVSASCYAKYYFHLRSMMRMLGLITVEREDQQPLDVNAANRLQLSPKTESVETSAEIQPSINRTNRCHSIAWSSNLVGPSTLNPANASLRRQRSLGSCSPHGPLVQLEQLVSSFHTDADGLEHVSVPIIEKQTNITPARELSSNSRYSRRRTYHW